MTDRPIALGIVDERPEHGAVGAVGVEGSYILRLLRNVSMSRAAPYGIEREAGTRPAL